MVTRKTSKEDYITEKDKGRLELLKKRLDEIRSLFLIFDIEKIKCLKDVFQNMTLYGMRLGGGTYYRKKVKIIINNSDKWIDNLSVDSLMRILNTSLVEKEIKDGRYTKSVPAKKSYLEGLKQDLNLRREQGVNDSILSLKTWFGNPHSDYANEMKDLRLRIKDMESEIIALENSQQRTNILDEVILLARKYNDEIVKIDHEIEKIKSTSFMKNKEAVLQAKLSKAASVDGKLRQDIFRVKGKIKATEECPYCCQKMRDKKHLDHIYPVSKGGLNIVDNLVYCCDSCNIIKTNKGLREFCRIREIDFLEVVDRLEKLGKHV